jgi:hypothetical protein
MRRARHYRSTPPNREGAAGSNRGSVLPLDRGWASSLLDRDDLAICLAAADGEVLRAAEEVGVRDGGALLEGLRPTRSDADGDLLTRPGTAHARGAGPLGDA